MPNHRIHLLNPSPNLLPLGGIFISHTPLTKRNVFIALGNFINDNYSTDEWFTVPEILDSFQHRSQSSGTVARCLSVFEGQGWVESVKDKHCKEYRRTDVCPFATVPKDNPTSHTTIRSRRPDILKYGMSDVIPENEQMLIVLFCKSQTKNGGYIPFEDITEFMVSNGMKYHANALRGFLGRWAGIKWVAPKLWRLTDEV